MYRVYSITRVNMGTHKIYRGIQYRTNILGSLYGDCHELLAKNRVMIEGPSALLITVRVTWCDVADSFWVAKTKCKSKM